MAYKGSFILPLNKLYGENLKEWFEICKSNLGRQTITIHEINIKKHINSSLIGQVQITELNVHHIEKFLTKLRKKGLAEAAIKKIFSLVGSSLISSVKKDIILKNVASFAKNIPKIKRKHVDVLDELEVKHFLNFVSQANTRYYLAFHLAIATRMHQGEILGLRWKDIDLDRAHLG